MPGAVYRQNKWTRCSDFTDGSTLDPPSFFVLFYLTTKLEDNSVVGTMFVTQQEKNKPVWLILKKCDLAAKLLILLTRDYHHQDYHSPQ